MKIVIIGGGPGGYEAAIRGAQLGAQVTLIEKEHLGGTCLNAGCIPTKVLYAHAKRFNCVENSEDFGILSSGIALNMDRIHENKSKTIQELRGGVKSLVEANAIRLVYGEAELLDDHHVCVLKDEVKEIFYGDQIVIATGSEPIIPNIPGVVSNRIMTSKEMLSLERVPESLVIVGGGVIGMEFASIYNALGSKVTVIDANKTILSQVDKDLSKRLMSFLKKKGVTFITDALVESFDTREEEASVVTVYENKGKRQTVNSELVLLSIGRKARIPRSISKLNMDFNSKGICVNEYYQTNINHIYAIGDVNGQYMLAHAASHQGQRVMEHILLNKKTTEEAVVPGCIFTFPEIAVVGQTENTLKAMNEDYTVSKFSFNQNGKAMTMQETSGYIKVIASNDRLVGVQIIGCNASNLIHEAALGITNKLAIGDYIKTVHAHPTLSETFLEAVRGLRGEAIHSMPTIMQKEIKIQAVKVAAN